MDLNWAISILYKIIGIGSGTFIVYLGYRLFVKGIYGDTGEIQLDWSDSKLMLKRAAPGSIFTIFGSIVLGVVIMSKASYSPNKDIGLSSLLYGSEESREKINSLLESESVTPEVKSVLSEVLKDLGGTPPSIVVNNPETNNPDIFEG
ncbi:hypothetical protein ACONUD_07525 [Microbulbifer harenosus]|uniref:Uncharacterized protein n=1 Tax=Microbulbifer harenosus TaxID=2576840 RepID=A0ABY2UCC7_9GAMM|nr:hypothetical protein [Microbulbifer harenosus]TLM72829.1 hypothetical protein FDY93_19305 [Microbulbifer harenosus]